MPVARLSSIHAPKKVTEAAPIIFVLRIPRGTFTNELASKVAHAVIGRNMTCRLSRQGKQDILTYYIGPRKHWWIPGSLDDLGVINALRAAQGAMAQ